MIELPQEEVARQYLPDVEGGFLYEVVTEVSVHQHPINYLDSRITSVQETIAQLQSDLSELQTQQEIVNTAISQSNPPVNP